MPGTVCPIVNAQSGWNGNQVRLVPPEFLGTFSPVAFAAVMGQPYARKCGRVGTREEVAIARIAPLTDTNVIDADFSVD